MRSIDFTDFANALRELNPSITFDQNYTFLYYGAIAGHDRTTIVYNDKPVCNCDTGDMPEKQVMGGKTIVPVMIHPDQRDYHRTSTRKFVVFEDHPVFAELHPQMGRKTVDLCSLGGGDFPVMAERAHYVHPVRGKEETAIIVRMYFEPRTTDNVVKRIGWRQTVKELLAADIPGVTKNTLERELGIKI